MTSFQKYQVAALYVDPKGPYPKLAASWWDEKRDALRYQGKFPVVAHPPCRSWSRLRHFAKAPAYERDLAILAVSQVRKFGGVLEHPSGSALWPYMNLPVGQATDEYGGYSIVVDQNWWGHKARKRTLLYIVGLKRSLLPIMPIDLAEPSYTVSTWSGHRGKQHRPEMPKSERHLTPPSFARWLCELASSVS